MPIGDIKKGRRPHSNAAKVIEKGLRLATLQKLSRKVFVSPSSGRRRYASGKVCLSILGTWAGPSWSPTQSLGSVLLSIQSLLHATP